MLPDDQRSQRFIGSVIGGASVGALAGAPFEIGARLFEKKVKGRGMLLHSAAALGTVIGSAAGAAHNFMKEGHMSPIHSFVDEIQKIAACKGRSGSTPIRAHNLAGSSVDKSSGQLKRANLLAGAKKGLGKAGLTAAGSIAAWEGGKGAVGDYQRGRAIRKQQEEYQKRLAQQG